MESSEVFINEEIEFSFEDEDYFWIGSYEVITEGEDADWDYPAYSETTINILGTIQFARIDKDTGMPVDCTPTAILEECIIETILEKL